MHRQRQCSRWANSGRAGAEKQDIELWRTPPPPRSVGNQGRKDLVLLQHFIVFSDEDVAGIAFGCTFGKPVVR